MLMQHRLYFKIWFLWYLMGTYFKHDHEYIWLHVEISDDLIFKIKLASTCNYEYPMSLLKIFHIETPSKLAKHLKASKQLFQLPSVGIIVSIMRVTFMKPFISRGQTSDCPQIIKKTNVSRTSLHLKMCAERTMIPLVRQWNVDKSKTDVALRCI